MGHLNGQRGAFQLPRRYGRNESGYYTVYRFNGTGREIDDIARQIDGLGAANWEVEEGYGVKHVEAMFGGAGQGLGDPTTDAVTLWEYFSAKAEKDLLQCDTYTGITAILSNKNVNLIQDFVAGNYPEGVTGDDITQDIFDNTEGDQAQAYTLFKLMKAGVRSQPQRVPTLRRTLAVASQFATVASLTNVGRIISTATLQSIENVPSNLLFNLPNLTPAAAFNSIELAYGWFKEDPSIQQIAMLKWKIVQEWQYGLWPVAIHGTPL